MNRIGKQEDCDHSAWKRPDCGPCYIKDEEAEQALYLA